MAHYFSNTFQKLVGNEYSSKQGKEFGFKVIYTSHISYFLEFRLDISIQKYFKVVSRIDSELWHIQDPRYIKDLVNIPCENLAY